MALFGFFTRGDDLGPPPPPFRVGGDQQQQQPQQNNAMMILIGIGLLILVVGGTAKELYTDWLWFESVSYANVFTTILSTRVGLFLMGALAVFIFVLLNVIIAQQLLPRPPLTGLGPTEARLANRMILLVILGATLFLAFIFGSLLSNEWQRVLAFFYEVPFNDTDPIFGEDAAFYVFSLPALRFFQTWSTGALTVTLLAVLASYAFAIASRGSLRRSTAVRAHATILGVAILLFIAWGYWLQRYELMYSQAGLVAGATYTDVNARIPVLTIQAGLAALTGLLLLVVLPLRTVHLPVFALIAWALVGAVGGSFYPEFVQRFQVEPNELARERPYIEHNISFTRRAFGLDRITEVPFPGEDSPSVQDLVANPATIKNIRLWDHEPLKTTYDQIQSIRRYYEFHDVDIDRYTINGEYRQVTLSARELAPERLSAEGEQLTWVNQRLKYTHGYGATLSPVNEISGEGLPNLLVKNLPPVTDARTPELRITQPEIYFGEKTSDWIIVNTDEEEVDYTSELETKYTRYAGKGGVVLDSLFKKLAFAWQMTDPNILLTGLRDESRILYFRNIQDRVRKVTPFLTLDRDPYLVILEGRLVYMQDAYTTTSRYPYSQRYQNSFNYIRNSAKAVVDAYNGEIQYYITHATDAIIQTYNRIFPGLFKPMSEMPAELRKHLRYPEDLFNAQSSQYELYHMQDPQVFYNKEDAYTRPLELYLRDERPMEAYYVIMRLPEQAQAQPEFMLILPFTPVNKNNTNAWLAGRSDGENYGKLLAFTFPKEKLVFGPRQAESRITQDPTIASQFTLWNQPGSGVSVLRGNLLFIPVAQSYIYVEPIYLQSAQSQLPELKRVVVIAGNRIAMETTLEESLNKVFGQQLLQPPTTPPGTTPPGTTPPSTTPPGTTPGATPPTGTPSQINALATQAQTLYTQAQDALKAGDFARYGDLIKQLQDVLNRMVELTKTP